MDKYEFNIKVEQIKKMAKVGDYLGAMKAADEIDWRRVSSVSLLTLVSEIYEKNRDYTEAKEILLLAYEKAPIGKRLLYKLTMLALSEGNIPEAEAYYREFYDLAPEDSRQHILRYLILKAKGAPVDQLINSLEQYTRDELDERWMYELAELYHKAGRSEECVAMCDKVMLMFGIGKYVDKAMDLKLNQEGHPLNEYQQNLIDNRDKYEARLKDMEEHPDKYDPDADAVVVEKPENYDQENMVIEEPAEYNTKPIPTAVMAGAATSATVASAIGGDIPVGETIAEDIRPTAEDTYQGNIVPTEEDEIVKADLGAILGGAFAVKTVGATAKKEEKDEIRIDEESIRGVQTKFADEAEAKAQAEEDERRRAAEAAKAEAEKAEAARIEAEKAETARIEAEKAEAARIAAIKASEAKAEAERIESEKEEAAEEQKTTAENNPDKTGEAEEEMTIYTVNFIVERRKEEDGVNAAVRLLKLMHEHTGSHNQVAKIKAGKLNSVGVLASKEKLAGKDLVIEQAGDLAYSIVEEVMELIKTEPTERVVVLIDNPMQIRKILSAYPELLQLFHVDKEEDSVAEEPVEEEPKKEAVPVVKTTESKKQAAPQPAYEDDYYDDPVPVPAPAPIKTQAGGMTSTSAERAAQSKMSEEMDIDDFANYAQEYAESIDCSISGKSKLALYERIELMEEDGIKLTRENAVALIEEAADKAEKKGIGSLFKAKYDKDDKLILREEHFVE